MQFWQFAVAAVEIPHVPEVACGKPIAPGKFGLEIPRQGFDNRFAPAEFFLLLLDGLADFPVERDQFTIDRPQRLILALADAGLELGQKFRVAGVTRCGHGGRCLVSANFLVSLHQRLVSSI